jgi:hypothetical protein
LIGETAAERTSRLLADTLADSAFVLQVDVPALGLAGGVLEGEGEDGVALLHGILAVGLAGVQGLVDLVEGRGGGELVCLGVSYWTVAGAERSVARELHVCIEQRDSIGWSGLPFLRDIVAIRCGGLAQKR